MKMEGLDYWQSKERLHRLRSETSRLRLQLKPEQRESRSARMDEGGFISFDQKQLAIAVEEKKAVEVAFKKTNMARQNFTRPSVQKMKNPSCNHFSRY